MRVRVEFRFSDDDVNRSRAVARSGNTELCQHHHSKRGKYRALSLPLMHDERERCLFGTGFCSEGSALRAILAVPLLCFGYPRKKRPSDHLPIMWGTLVCIEILQSDINERDS